MIKPKVQLVGTNGNIFNLMNIAERALVKHQMRDEAKDMIEKITKSESYTKALSIVLQYVDPIEKEGEYED